MALSGLDLFSSEEVWEPSSLGDRVSLMDEAHGIINWNTAVITEAAKMRHFDFAFGFVAENSGLIF